MPKQIAIIGGGGAGLACAWSLSRVHDVTLFEKETSLGGHATSTQIEVEGHSIPVDMGVEFFSEKQAPNFFLLLDRLQLPTYVAPLSFAARFGTEFWTNTGRGNLWPSIRDDCSRFHIQMNEIMHGLQPQAKGENIKEFLARNCYSNDFANLALFPLLTTFSSCYSPIEEYNLMFCAFAFGMGFLSFFHPTYWRKVASGIGSYTQALAQNIRGSILCEAEVIKVKRDNGGVTIFLKDQTQRRFDEVVLATHADQALRLLENPTSKESSFLGDFPYTKIHSVLYTRPSSTPSGAIHDCYLEYSSTAQDRINLSSGSLTRCLNALPTYAHLSTPVLVTFDPKDLDDEAYIIKEKTWKIPQIKPQDLLRRRSFREIQGRGHVWYCGTDTTLSGHESVITSGLVIADFLGAPYPFAHHTWAKIQYDTVKDLMGLYHTSEKIGRVLTEAAYRVAKKLGMHSSQAARVILDLYV